VIRRFLLKRPRQYALLRLPSWMRMRTLLPTFLVAVALVLLLATPVMAAALGCCDGSQPQACPTMQAGLGCAFCVVPVPRSTAAALPVRTAPSATPPYLAYKAPAVPAHRPWRPPRATA
jgi:hypothetical protein